MGFAWVAAGQVITVTGQDRYMEGSTVSMNFGVPSESGLVRVDAPVGDFGVWNQDHQVLGNVTVGGTQNGGFNGNDRFDLETFSMSLSGGGGPDQSGSGTFTSKFGFSFDVGSPINYVANGLLLHGDNVTVTFTLTGPNTNINLVSSNGALTLDNIPGSLQPGSYTLAIVGTGTVSFIGPGGSGSGVGGPPPMFSFVTTVATCAADLDNDGDFSNGGSSDGGVDINDLLYFLAGFEIGSSDVDLDNDGDPAVGTPDGGVDINDLLFFLARFEVGC
jgi:hypothetical protein